MMIIGLLIAIAIPNLLRAKLKDDALELMKSEGIKIRDITPQLTEEYMDKIYTEREKEKKIYKPPMIREKRIKSEFEKDFGRR